MKNEEGHYVFTESDIKEYQRILDSTYDVTIRSSSERGLKTYGYWKVTAPAGDKMYYTSDGFTLAEAIEKWFSYIKEKGVEPFFE